MKIIFLLLSETTALKIPDLFWSFEDSAGGVSHDAIHKTVARFLGGAKVVSTSARGHVASTSTARGWISLGDYKGNTSNDMHPIEREVYVKRTHYKTKLLKTRL